MATMVRTEEMFVEAVEADTAPRTGWESFIGLMSRILTPFWVKDYAEELAAQRKPHTWL